MTIHLSVLAGRIPWTEELKCIGSQRMGHNWSELACTHARHVSHHSFIQLTICWHYLMHWVYSGDQNIYSPSPYGAYDFMMGNTWSPWCWERLRAEGEEGVRGWDDWMASLMQWPWTWANTQRWWGTRRPGIHEAAKSWTQLATEQQQVHAEFSFPNLGREAEVAGSCLGSNC